MKPMIWLAALAALATAASTGCSTRELATGAVVGAGAYEYSNKRAIDELEDQRRSGRITTEEYERRRNDIEKRSLVY